MHPARVLLDSGSQTNFIGTTLTERLKLSEKRVCTRVTGINDTTTLYTREIISTLKSRTNRFTVRLPFLIRDDFRESMPTFRVDLEKLDLPSNVALADPQFYELREVEALLGVDIFYKLLCPKQKYLKSQNALLQKTKFIWLVTGSVPAIPSTKTVICNFGSETLNEEMAKFWELERVQTADPLSAEEAFCEQHYTDNTTRDDKTGKYIVKLPFKNNKRKLGESYAIASKHFYSLEKKLDMNPDLKTQYSNFLKKYISLGHMSQIDHAHNLLYLLHHGVQKETSSTTKLRVVFDASSKTTSGLSLNDVLQVDPLVQEDLFSILLRFRSHTYVITADIEKMYRQIILHPEDRVYQNILWRDNKNENLKTHRLNTITYGTSPDSFLAMRTLLQLSRDETSVHASTTRAIAEDFYMDDLLTGANTIEEKKILKNEIINITERGGLPLRKWSSNEPLLVTNNYNNLNHVNLNIDDTVKTLGLYWNPREDAILYTITKNTNSEITKRAILSRTAKLFDPLDLLDPVIIRAKIIMQRLWQIEVGWDDPLPPSISSAWSKYDQDLKALKSVRFNRKIALNGYRTIEIHGFCDASDKAYGACIYIKTSDHTNNSAAQLLCAKSKVAPVKSISLPRLELCAALLLIRLFGKTKTALRHTKFTNINLWLDSTGHGNSRKHDCKWRHVRSEENPADLLSRGTNATELIANDFWSADPTWLLESSER